MNKTVRASDQWIMKPFPRKHIGSGACPGLQNLHLHGALLASFPELNILPFVQIVIALKRYFGDIA
ncbi:MAG: hypothetical protein LAT83_16235 [Kiritimatiellae bacterium]|nr:hypothetical protein [Kiritimatiellia bacterium]